MKQFVIVTLVAAMISLSGCGRSQKTGDSSPETSKPQAAAPAVTADTESVDAVAALAKTKEQPAEQGYVKLGGDQYDHGCFSLLSDRVTLDRGTTTLSPTRRLAYNHGTLLVFQGHNSCPGKKDYVTVVGYRDSKPYKRNVDGKVVTVVNVRPVARIDEQEIEKFVLSHGFKGEVTFWVRRYPDPQIGFEGAPHFSK